MIAEKSLVTPTPETQSSKLLTAGVGNNLLLNPGLSIKALSKYKGAEIIWVQEEPMNMGSWSFILRELSEIGITDLISRKKSASPATGYTKLHLKEQEAIVNKSFELN